MRKLGLLALKYNLRVAYEAPSWGVHKDTWHRVDEGLPTCCEMDARKRNHYGKTLRGQPVK